MQKVCKKKQHAFNLIKFKLPNTLAIFSFLLTAHAAWANPTDGNVTAGNASISSNGNIMTILQSSPSAHINWQTFGIQSGETVNFVQPNSAAVAVNRVVGSEASQILGSMNANGQVFLINPNGIMFGSSAVVNTAGLVATTLDLTNADFTAKKYTFNGSAGDVTNAGTINSNGGYVVLMGNQLSNAGNIGTPNGSAAFIGGTKVTLGLQPGSPLTYQIDAGTLNAMTEISGSVKADKGVIILAARSIDAVQSGVVNLSGLLQGEILSIQNVNVNGVNGGGTIVTGGFTTGSGTILQPVPTTPPSLPTTPLTPVILSPASGGSGHNGVTTLDVALNNNGAGPLNLNGTGQLSLGNAAVNSSTMNGFSIEQAQVTNTGNWVSAQTSNAHVLTVTSTTKPISESTSSAMPAATSSKSSEWHEMTLQQVQEAASAASLH